MCPSPRIYPARRPGYRLRLRCTETCHDRQGPELRAGDHARVPSPAEQPPHGPAPHGPAQPDPALPDPTQPDPAQSDPAPPGPAPARHGWGAVSIVLVGAFMALLDSKEDG